ncbi:GpE family phage tail protein [Limnobaculum xujianqingii]|nr:GpE family phage tail protein [Limnobaculum xujianqingii]
MADIAIIFHWPPSEMYDMSITELWEWRAQAARRTENDE